MTSSDNSWQDFCNYITPEFKKVQLKFDKDKDLENLSLLQKINEQIKRITDHALLVSAYNNADKFSMTIDAARELALSCAINFLKQNLIAEKETIKKEIYKMLTDFLLENKFDKLSDFINQIILSEDYCLLSKYFKQIFGTTSDWVGMIKSQAITFYQKQKIL